MPAQLDVLSWRPIGDLHVSGAGPANQPQWREVVIASLLASPWSTWGIAGLATVGVITRPFSWPEFIWAVAGAGLLVALGLLSPGEAWSGVARGTDVYLFLTGMMLLSELARQEGLFEWLAARAARLASGSARRLFTLVFGVGTVVTVFLSNDATAVVLTPAVAAVVKAAEAKEPLPYLSDLRLHRQRGELRAADLQPGEPGDLRQPHAAAAAMAAPLRAAVGALDHWPPTSSCAGPSGAGWGSPCRAEIGVPALSAAGKMAAFGIVATGAVLLVSSGFDIQLGLPTFLAGGATALLVLTRLKSRTAGGHSTNISWGVLPLVAGLFVLVEALEKTGVTQALADAAAKPGAALRDPGSLGCRRASLAVGCNLVNNLPAGLVAGRVVELAHVPDHVRSAVLIGVDLGPNLSVTGSLATILWLTALRREGQCVSAWTFLKLGAAGDAARPPSRHRRRLRVRLNQSSGEQHAEPQRGLALSPHSHCRRAPGLGAADERRLRELA